MLVLPLDPFELVETSGGGFGKPVLTGLWVLLIGLFSISKLVTFPLPKLFPPSCNSACEDGAAPGIKEDTVDEIGNPETRAPPPTAPTPANPSLVRPPPGVGSGRLVLIGEDGLDFVGEDGVIFVGEEC